MARRRSRRSRSQPLDRLAIMAIAGLSLALGLLVLSGDHATARVRDFTWQDRQVGAEDQAFLLTFSRPMDVASVEQNLTLDPPLPGKVSWAGRRMAYTLTEPLPYGESFSVSLAGARDRYAATTDGASRFEPFQSRFETRPRAFLYIGAEGDEANRLVLADLSRQERTILTPRNLSVMAFKPYPLGDRVLFSASDINQAGNLLNQQIYTVTTGLTPRPPIDFMGPRPPLWQQLWPQRQAAPSGEIDLVLDNSTYQNLKFDLSADGQTIVVQRVNQQNPADFGPWIVRQGAAPQPIDTEPGGDFLIAPDSQSLLLLQGQGTAIIDLGAEQTRGPRQPLDFLPNYGRVLDVTADGSAAAMVNFNQDDPEKRFTESLFLVTNQGREEELLQVSGAIVDAQFDPTRQFLYVLASELVEAPAEADTLQADDAYVEQPLLLVITLVGGETRPLLRLPQQQRLHMSVAPDGRSLLIDLAGQTTPDSAAGNPVIWHLPLVQPAVSLQAAAAAEGFDSTAAAEPEGRTGGRDALGGDASPLPTVSDPEELPFSGLQATWLP
ncbi:Ig-like domain-containing protein [Nodosilinea sp. PGN35]|uniref:Ig-like domain-containing protein n=1 Tax=Nodosilinea sp. PGN35 TaxID=3020489 RepID=UPI0023B2A75A|nr:Ig-like domain-containing protein [Nodosilinea sp. TSF1-S3]MDF0366175.1 Ig-like domain-containing protein [Nodosilinea sp. TSF1-S3]